MKRKRTKMYVVHPKLRATSTKPTHHMLFIQNQRLQLATILLLTFFMLNLSHGSSSGLLPCYRYFITSHYFILLNIFKTGQGLNTDPIVVVKHTLYFLNCQATVYFMKRLICLTRKKTWLPQSILTIPLFLYLPFRVK